MATTTGTVTLQIIGEHLLAARADIHGLKTGMADMEDRLRTEFGGRFDGIDRRLDGIDRRMDGIDGSLAKIINHLGIGQ